MDPEEIEDEIAEEIIIEDEPMDILSDDEFEITAFGQSADEDIFDQIVGRIEEIVMSDEFNNIQERFVKTYGSEFTAEEENKLIYMDIFQKYQSEIENYIEQHLENLDMNKFTRMLMERQNEIDGSLLEMLLSFSDFQVFKELMLSYKNSSDLQVAGTASIIHTDEVIDGDEIPDFQGLIITNAKHK
jgi:ADP-ribosylation factor-like protein 2-binding protein